MRVSDANLAGWIEAVGSEARDGHATESMLDLALLDLRDSRARGVELEAQLVEARGKYEQAERSWYRRDDRRDAALDTVERYGFRHCDAPACNCGSFHAPDGFLMPDGAAKLRAQLAQARKVLGRAEHHLPMLESARGDIGEMVDKETGGLADPLHNAAKKLMIVIAQMRRAALLASNPEGKP